MSGIYLTRDAGPKPHIVGFFGFAEKNPRGPYIVGQIYMSNQMTRVLSFFSVSTKFNQTFQLHIWRPLSNYIIGLLDFGLSGLSSTIGCLLFVACDYDYWPPF